MDEIRLIDANALKEEINKMWGTPQNRIQVLKTIDNAPTVEFHYKPKIMKIDKDGNAEFEYIPQGEWLHKEFDPFLKEYGQCSNCLQRERVGNFCRNCGADMRPEKKAKIPSCLTNPERQAELLERYKEE